MYDLFCVSGLVFVPLEEGRGMFYVLSYCGLLDTSKGENCPLKRRVYLVIEPSRLYFGIHTKF